METLVQYNAMRQALIKAHKIDEVMEIRDRAEALRLYAKQTGENHEHVNLLAEIKVRAERRTGDLIREMQEAGELRSRGGNGSNQHEQNSHDASFAPTVEDFGLTYSQSSRYQAMAAIPETVFEDHVAKLKSGRNTEVTTAATLKLAKSVAYQKKDADRAAVTSSLPPTVKLYHGDFREQCQQIPDDSIDFILTDPPYPVEFLPLWGDLAKLAARVLKPGGYLFAYSGQTWLPDIYRMLGECLDYQWTAAVQHKNGYTRIWKHDLLNAWKPILIYSKGKPEQTLCGMVDLFSGGQGNKDEHEWSQPETEAAYYINYMTLPGQTVLDTFMGSGTVIAAAHKLNRCAIGCEIDEHHYTTARGKF